MGKEKEKKINRQGGRAKRKNRDTLGKERGEDNVNKCDE